MNKLLKLATFLGLVFTTASCTSLKSTEQSRGQGTHRTFSKSYNKVYKAAINATRFAGLKIVSENKKEGKILATHGISLMSLGENIAIFIKENGKQVEIEIISQKNFITSIFVKDWESIILKNIEANL